MQSMNFNEALAYAKALPTHTDGKLNQTYVMFESGNCWFSIIYDNSPLSVFRSLRSRKRTVHKGFIYAAGEKLLYHVPYSRKDTEVTSVSFDIVGVKRQTTKLPAGVLINNINFIV